MAHNCPLTPQIYNIIHNTYSLLYTLHIMHTNIPQLCTIIYPTIHIQNRTPLGTTGYAHPGPRSIKPAPAAARASPEERGDMQVSVYESVCECMRVYVLDQRL